MKAVFWGKRRRAGNKAPESENRPAVAPPDHTRDELVVSQPPGQRSPNPADPPDLDDATRRLLNDFAETASMACEAEEQQYFAAAAKLGVTQLAAARARSQAIQLVMSGHAEHKDLYGVALRLLAE